MLCALSYVLFSKPHRNVNKPQLVNSINQKNCEVTVTFKIHNNQFKVIRGMKPNIFEIWKNGKLLNQESHSRDYQQVLEANILGLTHKSFHQVVVLGSGNFTPFMQLPSWQRRLVIEDLLDISVFTQMNLLVKEELAKLRDSITLTENDIELVRTKIDIQTKHLKKLKSLSKEKKNEFKNEIAELKLVITNLSKDKAKHQKVLNDNLKNITTRLGEQKALLIHNEWDISSVAENKGKLGKEAQFYQENDNCSTCEQSMSPELKAERRAKLKTESKKLLTRDNDLKKSHGELEKTISEIQSTFDKLQVRITDTNRIDQEINSKQRQVQSLSTKISEIGTTDIDSDQDELEALRIECSDLENRRFGLLDEKTYKDTVIELLKDGGIKTKVIRQYLPIMNQLINQYLQILDFFVSFNLDDSFTETIRSRHCDTFSYASFSEGEKQRIDLSLLFAWRNVAKMKNSVNTNLLILDETFDSSLDADGVDNLLKILNTLDAGTSVFVISHKKDLLEGKFDRKLTFTKKNNFSEYTENE